MQGMKLTGTWQLVVELALRFPASQIESPFSPTIQANSIAVALMREWSTHPAVPATKQPSYPTRDVFGYGARVSLCNVWTVNG